MTQGRRQKRSLWSSVLWALSAFPVLVASVLLRLVGQRAHALTLASWVQRQWLRPDGDISAQRAWKNWAALLLALPVFAITLYLLTGVMINLAYPLRPDSQPSDWGGPSLAGRWALHGAGGVLFAVVTPPICAGLRILTQRILTRALDRAHGSAGL